MDVHRARFIPYPTHTISCLAFSRSNDRNSSSTKPTLRLALARTDGSIEIWNPQNGEWTQERVFSGDKDEPVDNLVWTQEPDYIGYDGETVAGQYRLFSTGSRAKVTEWDLETGQVKRRCAGNFAEVWCIAAQPRTNEVSTLDKTASSQDLVIGCGNGVLALLKTSDDDLQFKRILARISIPKRKKERCMTVTYQKRDVVVAGFSDSTIRVFNATNGNEIRTMSVGVAIPGAPKTTIVWKVLSLANGDVATADSNGEVKIWDGKMWAQKEQIVGHEGDVLDLAATGDGKTLFSSGVDGRVACYKRTEIDGRLNWGKVFQRKVHKDYGPVKVLAAYDGSHLSTLVVGGEQPAAMVVPIKTFGKSEITSLPFLPQRAPVISSPTARLTATWWDNRIYIYRFAERNSNEVLREEESAFQQLAVMIKLETEDKIQAMSISPDGDIVAASTHSGVRAFQLVKHNTKLSVRKIKLPSELDESGAKLLSLAGDSSEGTWLAAINYDNEIQITKLVASKQGLYKAADLTIELERPSRKHADKTGFRTYNTAITQLLFSEDADTLIVGDLSGHLDIWELDGDFDLDQKCVEVSAKAGAGSKDDSDSDSDDEETEVVLYGQTWKPNLASLPRLESAPLVLTFRPSAEQNLIDSQLGDAVVPAHRQLLVITARHQLYEFDIQEGRLTDWSRRNTSSSLPAEFTKTTDRVMGAHWDPRERLWLYGSSFVFMLDVSDDLQPSRKRKRQEDSSRTNKRSKNGGADSAVTKGTRISGPLTALKVNGSVGRDLDLSNGVHEEDDDALVELGLPTEAEGGGDSELRLRRKDKTLQSWSTTKYRPILGMVALAHTHKSGDADDALEVVIVERPPTEEKKRGKEKR